MREASIPSTLLSRPYRAQIFASLLTQGAALGYYITPLWGSVRGYSQNSSSITIQRRAKLGSSDDNEDGIRKLKLDQCQHRFLRAASFTALSICVVTMLL
jgi:hypothetical protein